MDTKTPLRRVFLFCPGFNVADKSPLLLDELDDLNAMLEKRHFELHVLLIDDCSTDDTPAIFDRFAASHPFVTVRHHSENQGNSATVQEGYTWAATHDQAEPGDILACCDSDGEHTPLNIPRYIRMLAKDNFDGVCGTIIYPPHAANWTDLNMMRFFGSLQADLAGADNPFYIQSAGFQVHVIDERLRRVITQQLPDYRDWLKHKNIDFPRHGTHGVIIQMLGAQDAKLHSAYLACFGIAPNRTPAKMIEQAKAALLHAEMVTSYLADTASG